MTAKDIVAELKKLGTEQTKKMWMTHGAQEPCLGVKVEDMKKIQKRVKVDYQLALDLYDTGIADAMYLAGLIADDAKMTKKDLQKWIENATWGMVAEYTEKKRFQPPSHFTTFPFHLPISPSHF